MVTLTAGMAALRHDWIAYKLTGRQWTILERIHMAVIMSAHHAMPMRLESDGLADLAEFLVTKPTP